MLVSVQSNNNNVYDNRPSSETFWLTSAWCWTKGKHGNYIGWLKRNLMTLILDMFNTQKIIVLVRSWIWRIRKFSTHPNRPVNSYHPAKLQFVKSYMSRLLARMQYCWQFEGLVVMVFLDPQFVSFPHEVWFTLTIMI